MSNDQRRRRLAQQHGLAPSSAASTVVDAAESVVALHSSDPISVFLSVSARVADVTVADVERALYTDRSLVRVHAMRRTLWVMTPSMAAIAQVACTRKIAQSERRRLVKFLDGDEAWLDDAIERMGALLADDGPLTAREIGRRLPELERRIVLAAGTKHEASASGHSRALQQAGFEGVVMRAAPTGSWISSQYAWEHGSRWVPIDRDGHDEAGAVSLLVQRWLERFGPGTLDDIQWWTGLTKTAVRKAVDGLDIITVDLDNGSDGLVLADDEARDDDVGPWVTLLPGLDPTAMGWKQRTWYLDLALARRVTDRFGNIGPTVWADGRIVGGWAQRDDGSIATEITGRLSAGHRRLLAVEIDRVMAFVGDARPRVRFPSPNQKDLLA